MIPGSDMSLSKDSDHCRTSSVGILYRNQIGKSARSAHKLVRICKYKLNQYPKTYIILEKLLTNTVKFWLSNCKTI